MSGSEVKQANCNLKRDPNTGRCLKSELMRKARGRSLNHSARYPPKPLIKCDLFYAKLRNCDKEKEAQSAEES